MFLAGMLSGYCLAALSCWVQRKTKEADVRALQPCVICGRDTAERVTVTTKDGTCRTLTSALCNSCPPGLRKRAYELETAIRAVLTGDAHKGDGRALDCRLERCGCVDAMLEPLLQQRGDE
jgi:hypothetical protein